MDNSLTHPAKQNQLRIIALLALITAAWFAAYNLIQPLADWISYSALHLTKGSHLGDAIAFFLYDVPKILLLLSGMIFLISILRTFFSPERTRALLGGKRQGIGNVLASLLGIVTPFCSCSAVPLFIGFVESGIPLGVTFSFLIAAPTINEVAIVMLFGLFGWKVAGLYILSGLIIAIIAGVLIGRLKLERYVEDFVWQMQSTGGLQEEKLAWTNRIERAWESVKEIVGKVWLYVIAGIAVGAGIHGYVPETALVGIMGKQAWWSVPAAVLLGVPLYSNAAGVIPIVSALMEKGASLGTVLAFMMSVVGLSLPETIILRRVLKPQLITVFIGTVALAIIITGYLFNLVL
ncbi:permease [Leptolinea tardivitalis]|uniref:Membrane protein n=1 Tax=Leptolinea tardivitalis TaxID=229920 RepID=A0A0P6X862_9CHLR|nr:permease [Leptolinea tardivitalis]KPL70391.1 membrane protein [Leptolinea tardivitalis]GAP21960.1 predicted permeases [Leptolinea tardivitalis]